MRATSSPYFTAPATFKLRAMIEPSLRDGKWGGHRGDSTLLALGGHDLDVVVAVEEATHVELTVL